MKSKKAASLPMTILVVAIILLIVLVIYLGVFQGLFKKEADHISCQIENLGDQDGDGIVNMFDKCCKVWHGNEVGVDGCGEGDDEGPCCP